MKKREIDWSQPQRQSAFALLLLLQKALISVIRFIWPFVLLMLFRKKSSAVNSTEITVLVVSILTLARSAIEYFTFRFSIKNNELCINKGFFIKKSIILPLEKIQAVHTEQTWLHNICKVSRVSFDSAGSEKMEVRIEALDQERTTSLRNLILGTRALSAADITTSEQPGENIIITLSGKDLYKLCFSANHLEAFFILLAFGFSFTQSIGLSNKEYTGAMKWFYTTMQTDTGKFLLLLVTAVLIISIGISVVKIMLTYFEFVISSSAKGFRIRTGLVNKNEKYVPFRKIQFISWKANWLRQKIGMYILQFHATGADHFKNKMHVKVPVTRHQFIDSLLENYNPALPVRCISTVRVQKKYIWRMTLLAGILPCLLIFPALYFFTSVQALFVFLLPGFIWLRSYLFHRKFRLYCEAKALQIKKGVWGSHELILKWNKVQSVQLQEGIYQRKHKLATIKFSTAGGVVIIPYILLSEAQQIQNYCLYKVESATEPWS